jgi:shikimate kinase
MNTILSSDSDKSIVMIGLMGSGKSSIGRRLADALGLEFIDTDDEIIKAAGCSIPDIFEIYGEQAFRDLEERVVERLLHETRCVMATGGGAYMRPETRERIDQNAITVWLRAELDILVERTGRRGGRPLLEQGNPEEILKNLMDERYPIYANADITVDTGPDGHEVTVQRIKTALTEFAETSS